MVVRPFQFTTFFSRPFRSSFEEIPLIRGFRHRLHPLIRVFRTQSRANCHHHGERFTLLRSLDI